MKNNLIPILFLILLSSLTGQNNYNLVLKPNHTLGDRQNVVLIDLQTHFSDTIVEIPSVYKLVDFNIKCADSISVIYMHSHPTFSYRQFIKIGNQWTFDSIAFWQGPNWSLAMTKEDMAEEKYTLANFHEVSMTKNNVKTTLPLEKQKVIKNIKNGKN